MLRAGTRSAVCSTREQLHGTGAAVAANGSVESGGGGGGGGEVRPLSSQLHLPDVDGSVSGSKRLSACSADACEYSVGNGVVERVCLVESKC